METVVYIVMVRYEGHHELEAVFSTRGKAEIYLKKNFARTGYIIRRDVL